ncbi:hypothetical protein pdul_cds_860 [Pandoravirus dulcis]|uniref:Uncharacterized protein n=1 Tax=Pandoravirus dulcis TaxID=1349409 RepID=S4VRS5_9VIRU|nr:hypothetical protein pdul_cds_860 [Pandoravirus dulcis]AGO83078.1 hypothetical protein pdul_cds_860 [Pandoravirus dulcis]
MAGVLAEKSDTAPAHSASVDDAVSSRLGTAALACIGVALALQLALVAATIGTLAIRSPENAAGCERLVNGLFTLVCLASAVAATALAAQAWRDRASDAALGLLHGAHGADHRDVVDTLDHHARATDGQSLIIPCAAPDVYLEMADTTHNQGP